MSEPGPKPGRVTPGCRQSGSPSRSRSHGHGSPLGAYPRIRAVTFDVGGTLIEVWPSVGHVYAEVAAWHGVEGPSAGMINRRFAAAWKAARQFKYSRAHWAGLGWNEQGGRRFFNDRKDKSL